MQLVHNQLSIANRGDSSLDITSSTGTDATVPPVSTTEAGQCWLQIRQLDGIGTGAEPNVDPSMSYTAAADGGTLTLFPGSDLLVFQ